ncbi:hypothetical protein GGD38_005658 [Chitinophagaceae bacterium OAS944]|nr:hypothetical protein [Chitinophagaceae bacterium OAS944]
MYMKHIRNRGFAWAWSGFGLGLVCFSSVVEAKELIQNLPSGTAINKKRRPDAKREDRRSFQKKGTKSVNLHA